MLSAISRASQRGWSCHVPYRYTYVSATVWIHFLVQVNDALQQSVARLAKIKGKIEKETDLRKKQEQTMRAEQADVEERYKHEVESLKTTTSGLENQLKNAGVEVLQLKQSNEALQHEMQERDERERALVSGMVCVPASVQLVQCASKQDTQMHFVSPALAGHTEGQRHSCIGSCRRQGVQK